MKSVNIHIHARKIVALALLLLVFCFTSTAMAAGQTVDLIKKLPITGSSFEYTKTIPNNPPHTLTIQSAKVTLSPENAIGTLDSIVITGPDGREFGCSNIKVKNGSNLIKDCGGNAVLKAGGSTTYAVKGSGFGPESKTIISVQLLSDP
ncbi:MAG: hypothetical protein ACRC06_11385 [Waterburya sp.]